MLKKHTLFALMLFVMFFAGTGRTQAQKHSKYAIIGYVGGYRGLIDTTMVNAAKLTVINYAFVDVQHNRAWLTNRKTDTINFRYLTSLRKKNPGLKIVISIGGWSWSKNFSDAVLSLMALISTGNIPPCKAMVMFTAMWISKTIR